MHLRQIRIDSSPVGVIVPLRIYYFFTFAVPVSQPLELNTSTPCLPPASQPPSCDVFIDHEWLFSHAWKAE